MPNELVPLSDRAKAIQPGRYRHYKGGEYLFVGVAHLTEDDALAEYVVYQSLENTNLWVRPIDLFLGQVETEGYSGSRFTHLGIS